MAKVAMHMLDRGVHADEARSRLADALGDARIDEPDETGLFEIELEAEDQEAALQRVWDAVAAAGADDHVAFAEHPDLPEHWRIRTAPPDS